METQSKITEQKVWKILDRIPDPEIPVISIVELGVVRSIEVGSDTIYIKMTPTYSGCPALMAMQAEIKNAIEAEGWKAAISLQYKPAWTTDWLSDETKKKLEDYGIAPPVGTADAGADPFTFSVKAVHCPFCKSADTKITSIFGSTACKSLHFCNSCMQPFEHFKCH